MNNYETGVWALPKSGVCKSCGEDNDRLPWGFCIMCTAVILDMSREPAHRLNSQEFLDAHIQKIVDYEKRKLNELEKSV